LETKQIEAARSLGELHRDAAREADNGKKTPRLEGAISFLEPIGEREIGVKDLLPGS
jgi:hypothetical protein